MSNSEIETGDLTIVQRIRNFGKRTVTIASILPPYILIGVLFLFQQQASKNVAEENKKEALVVDFKACVTTARARVTNKANFYGLYQAVRGAGSPEAVAFADKLQAEFDEGYNKLLIRVPDDCLQAEEFKGKFTREDFPPER